MSSETTEAPAERKHLWEIDHPYYCNDGNYFARESVESRFATWGQFIEHDGDADFDYNLVFRFDWHEGEDHELGAFNGDPYYRNGELKIYWMGQRKGLYRYSTIQVCRADEPGVILWLKLRWQHMQRLWEGIADLPATDAVPAGSPDPSSDPEGQPQ